MTTPSNQEYIRNLIEQRERSIQTAFAAKVISYNPNDSTVQVEPQFIEVWRNREGEREREPSPAEPEDAYIDNVPVAFPRAGSLSITYPIPDGSFGLVICTKYSLNQWREAGTAGDPGDLRRFTMDGAVFMPVNLVPDSDSLDASAATSSGCVEVGTGGATDFVALKKDVDDIKGELDKIAATFGSIVFTVDTGDGSGTPGAIGQPYSVGYTPTYSKNFKVETN